MAHRLSGAQKRARRNALKRGVSNQVQHNSSDEREAVETQQRRRAPARGSRQHILEPTIEEVTAAVESLYLDESKPVGRLLRKRIVEIHASTRDHSGAATSIGSSIREDQLPEVDMVHLRSVCEASDRFVIEPEEGGDWSAILIGRQSRFVDVYSTVDVYPEEMWAAMATYFEESGDDLTLPGGRYSCAQVLCARRLPFLHGISLGQVCHIVQLAMTQRKLLGYLSGAIVPYNRSSSRVKELCAGQNRACDKSCPEAADLSVASWEQARHCMRIIVEEAASRDDRLGVVPLSCVKRLFRSQFQLELSETVLGHSKLSELLQDAKFAGVCSVKLDGQGYSVMMPSRLMSDSIVAEVESFAPPSVSGFAEGTANSIAEEDAEVQVQGFCENEPLCLEDAGEFNSDVTLFGPTPGPFESLPARMSGQVWSDEQSCNAVYFQQLLSLHFEDSIQPQNAYDEHVEGYVGQFCSDEPLCFDDAIDPFDESVGFGPTPGPFGPTPGPVKLPLAVFACTPPASSPPVPQRIEACSFPSVDATANVVLAECNTTAVLPKTCVLPWSAPSPWKDGKLDDMVQNTFIHVSFPSTPPAGSLRRAASLGDLTDGSTSTRVSNGGRASDDSSTTSLVAEMGPGGCHKDSLAESVSASFCLDVCNSIKKQTKRRRPAGRRRVVAMKTVADQDTNACSYDLKGGRAKAAEELVDIVVCSMDRQIHGAGRRSCGRRRRNLRSGAAKEGGGPFAW
eukprot:TRINITY_DN21_c0_g2_i1.p1 TRINITY_DN21_c0_g2~~TRINITY_DN21_c0_g2_i1.p1  ORF type:complete len:756 (+),score=125.60 TRINITY_DN21_c0_g2_i1:58-2268(+)